MRSEEHICLLTACHHSPCMGVYHKLPLHTRKWGHIDFPCPPADNHFQETMTFRDVRRPKGMLKKNSSELMVIIHIYFDLEKDVLYIVI